TRGPLSSKPSPRRLVALPPASSRMTGTGAASHRESSGSAEISTVPSPPITCGPKARNAQVLDTEGVRPRKDYNRPCSSLPVRDEKLSEASESSVTFDTWHREACDKLRPCQVPPPCEAHQRRCSAGADTTPTTGRSPSRRAMRVAHTGTPRT